MRVGDDSYLFVGRFEWWGSRDFYGVGSQGLAEVHEVGEYYGAVVVALGQDLPPFLMASEVV